MEMDVEILEENQRLEEKKKMEVKEEKIMNVYNWFRFIIFIILAGLLYLALT